MNPRTAGTLALCPVGNGQVSFYFLSIATGRILNRLHATALPMPDCVIDKIHRMAQQQKNNPGLIFADHNLNPDEYDDDDDDETYYDNGDDDEDDEEVLSYDEVEGNDNDGNEMAAHRLPVANDDEEGDDDNNDEMGAHDPPMVDVPPPVDLVQPPDNPPREITGVEAADQAEEHGVPMGPEIPGVEEEEAEPKIPGVGEEEEDDADDDVDDQSTQDEVTVEPPPAPPEAENNPGSRYNLHSGRNQNHNHRYAGEDFVIDNEVGIIMTTKGCSELLETLQMSLKAGL